MSHSKLLPAALTACLVLGGCATQSRPGSSMRAPDGLHERGLGGRVVAVPAARERLRHLALQEWTLWGRGRWDAATNVVEWPAGSVLQREDAPDYVARVLHYWYAYREAGFDTADAVHDDGSLVPWSGAFVSYLMKTAGIGADRFAASGLHWDYIKAIHDAPDPGGFQALDAAAEAPAVGDLICAPRGGTAERVTSFAHLASRESRGAYHCDLVVEIDGRTLDAIGGNVFDGVMRTSVRLRDGKLLQPTPARPWIVILRNNVE